MLGAQFIFIKVLSDDFEDVDIREDLCYHSRPKKQNSKGEKRTKDECRKAGRGGKSGSRSQAVQRGRLRHRRAFRSGFPIFFGGVGLSAAARSAAALVYDKLTPNCHLLNLIWKKADINYGACLYMCIEFSIISKRAVQRIVPLPNARFPVVYRSPADTEFGTDFRLPHAVHIAIQDGKFQSG